MPAYKKVRWQVPDFLVYTAITMVCEIEHLEGEIQARGWPPATVAMRLKHYRLTKQLERMNKQYDSKTVRQ